MFLSIVDMFKIGIGPSSSHTLGPMKAGKAFADDITSTGLIEHTSRVQVDLYGSLSLTGKGHATDKAVVMGLAGNVPETVDIDAMPGFLANVSETGFLPIGDSQTLVRFPRELGVVFHVDSLPLHENGMTITALDADNAVVFKKTYYSIGGGFIVDEEHFGSILADLTDVPFEFSTAREMLDLCERHNLSIPELSRANEEAAIGATAMREHLAKVRAVMEEGIERGTTTDGILPGKLQVPRRAKALKARIDSGELPKTWETFNWVNMFAMAINEENAAGGRVVTAPTNGACGVVPAVMAYYNQLIEPVTDQMFEDYILTCTQIGKLYKLNASISGAEVGCQGEVGVACSMAAGGLAQLMGGTPEQVCIAAEIAMEHNLGLTCDPVCGQVQVPCIERNAVGGVDAINAANMALQRESAPRVQLDDVITTMYQTGKDMDPKYRETSQGGLALVVVGKKPMPCS